MKQLIIALALGMAAIGAWGQCVPGQEISNSMGWQQNIAGTLGTTVLTKFWEVGNAAGANSGSLASTSMAISHSSGFYVNTNWGNSGVVGCPAPGGRTAFLYSIANAGAAKFLAMSVAKTGSIWSFDTITNGPGNTPSPVSIPSLVGSSYSSTANGRDEVVPHVTWTPLTSAQLRGYYDSDPGMNLVTGYAIRYWQGSSAPTNFSTSAWTYAGTVVIGPSGSDPGQASVSVPWTMGLGTWVALSVLFDGQQAGTGPRFCETAFVGPPGYITGPFPGEIAYQGWSSKTTMVWDFSSPIEWYSSVYRGQGQDLPLLLEIAGQDSCRWAPLWYANQCEMPTVPCPGEFFWYLVTATVEYVGSCPPFGWCYREGSAGYATAGERVLNSSGACATPDPCP